MSIPSGDASEKLCAEILAEGERRAQEIREEAEREGEALLARAALEAETARAQALESARREGERRRERILAGVPIEVARHRAAHIERLLLSLRGRAREALSAREGFEYQDSLVLLACEALEQMTGASFVLELSPSDLAACEGLAEEILRRIQRPGLKLALEANPSITEGGFILRDADGLQLWDDRLSARLDRLWPAMRLPIAKGLGLAEGGTP